MAKFIKCPTCGARLEYQPQSIGQVLKCTNCGKAIKLVKKGSTPPAAGAAASAPSPSLSDSQRSFSGEPAFADDPPALETSACANCGKLVDSIDLVEDGGQLICKACAAAARNARSAEKDYDLAAPRIEARRGGIITFSPSFFALCTCLFILLATQVYLSLNPLPKFHQVSRPATGPSTGPTTMAASQPAEDPEALARKAIEEEQAWESANRDEILNRLHKADVSYEEKNREEAKKLYDELFGFIAGHRLRDPLVVGYVNTARSRRAKLDEPETTQPTQVATPQNPEPPKPVTPVAPSLPALDPDLVRGMEAMERGDFATAHAAFDKARLNLRMPTMGQLSREQAFCLEALAASSIGMGRPMLGDGPAARAMDSAQHTRSLVLNWAQIRLLQKPLLPELSKIATEIRTVLHQTDKDEVAANVMGATLEQIGRMNLPAEGRAKHQEFVSDLDQYCDQMAADHPGQLKWGIEWLPREDVERYRKLRGGQLETMAMPMIRKLENARRDLVGAQTEVENATRAGRDPAAGKAKADKANATIKELTEQLRPAYYPPHWLDRPEPVIPTMQQ